MGLPCSLSTNLVLEAAEAAGLLRAYRYLDSPWQGDHPLQGTKMSFLFKIALDTIFQCCPSCELSAREEQARKQKEVTGDLVQHALGWMCSTAHPATLACSVKHQQKVLWRGLQDKSKEEKGHAVVASSD